MLIFGEAKKTEFEIVRRKKCKINDRRDEKPDWKSMAQFLFTDVNSFCSIGW